jgi:hypothetical protein
MALAYGVNGGFARDLRRHAFVAAEFARHARRRSDERCSRVCATWNSPESGQQKSALVSQGAFSGSHRQGSVGELAVLLYVLLTGAAPAWSRNRS